VATKTNDSPEERAYAKLTWRLLPFLFTCYVFAYLDRVNVGFAKLQILNDLKFSETVYGLGAGIFFIGYFLFEVPSNLIMYRVGARVWITRIMVTWGLLAIAIGIAFVNSVGNISGFIAPYMVGWIKDTTGRTDPALWVIAGSMTIASLLVFLVPARLVNK
jgi:sugar phosphate permease